MKAIQIGIIIFDERQFLSHFCDLCSDVHSNENKILKLFPLEILGFTIK